MTTTAQGTRMRCDQAGCTEIATVEVDAWGYCAGHAGKTVRATPSVSVSLPTPMVTRDLSGGAIQTMPTSTIGLLLEQASGHSSKRVTNLAGRIETQLEQLRQLVADLAEDEKRKQAARAAKDKARADVARLEAELAAAKAQLRRKPATAAKPRQAYSPERIAAMKAGMARARAAKKAQSAS